MRPCSPPKRGIKNINLSAVGGPCLAPGLANRVHSAVVIANKNLDTARTLSEMLKTEYYHVLIEGHVYCYLPFALIKIEKKIKNTWQNENNML